LECRSVERAIDAHILAGLDIHVRGKGVIQLVQEIVLGDGPGCHVIEAIEGRMMLDDIPQHLCEGSGRQAGEPCVSVALGASVALRKEPFEQTRRRREFASDDRSSERQAARAGDFTQQFGAPVQIVRIRRITLGVVAAAPGKYAIGADVDQAGAERAG
jgi:hypothetical protein